MISSLTWRSECRSICITSWAVLFSRITPFTDRRRSPTCRAPHLERRESESRKVRAERRNERIRDGGRKGGRGGGEVEGDEEEEEEEE